MEAKWKVPAAPRQSQAFYSPWFGIETSDNLNLLQPVNPWLGDHWEMYIEYFQWRPTHNEDSDQHTVNPGDVLHGVVVLNEQTKSYDVTHTNINSGWSVQHSVAIQREGFHLKNYTIAYIVFEKEAECHEYPPNGEVTFYDIVMEYEGQRVSPKWTTDYVDDVCNNRAHVLNETSIQITWDTN